MKTTISIFLLTVLSSIVVLSSAQNRCMPGSFNDKTGREPCIACQRGTYSRKLGKMKCRRCKEGYSTVSAWSRSPSSCTKCPNGMSSCRFCPAGSVGTNGIEPCKPCLSGTASSGGQSRCQRCDIRRGYISGGDRADECKRCPPYAKAHVGDFCVQNIASCSTTDLNVRQSCRLCQPGTSSPSGYEPCAPCPLGMLSNEFGRKSCMECKFGSSTPYSGARSLGVCESPLGNGLLPTREPTPSPVAQPQTPRVCVAGSQPVGDDCVPCSSGSYKSVAGSGVCEACPKDTFQEATGQSSCKPCAEGYLTRGVGSTSCIYCPNESR